MRDRRGKLGKGTKDQVEALDMPDETEEDRQRRQQKRIAIDRRKGSIYYFFFVVLFLGIPLFIIIRATPFFVIEQMRCRVGDKLWRDATVANMEVGYTKYFSEPPLYLSEAYNRSVFWGTYEPSLIFAMKSRSEQPITVGIAWYDEGRAHPLRLGMPFVHNKVNMPRTTDQTGKDPEVMRIRWIVHDGLHYGKQMIVDTGNLASFEIEFLKGPSGNSWHVRVQGRVASRTPLHMVLYIVNGDVAEPIVVDRPDGHNDGDWSPILNSRLLNHQEEKEAFTLRVFDRHNPLFDTAPWRVYGLHTPADEAFMLVVDDVVGGTPEERVAADGKGIANGHKAEQLRQRRLDLRDLPSSAFSYITSEDPASFRSPLDGSSMTGHNVIVMKKAYTTDFRLEVSLSPANEAEPARAAKNQAQTVGVLTPHYDALSSCQLTNIFRRREKRIYAHARKIFKPMAHKRFRVSGALYEHLAAQTLGETFGSFSFTKGRYQFVVDPAVDASWDEQGRAVALWTPDLVKPSVHVAGAFAAIGSRTDEAFGQQFLTGLEMLFVGRWNKEVVKDAVASWLVGAQNPATGFIPSLATFSQLVQSLTPASLRAEHPTISRPPAILLALQELLNEMERKGARVRARAQQQKMKTKIRNTPEYYEAEQAADRAFLVAILPSLQRWRAWWHKTQCGGATEELARACNTGDSRRPLESWPARPTEDPQDQLVYRWRSRDGHRLTASGMEDYPRPVCVGEHVMEAHVDLFSWIALLSEVISRIEVGHLGHPAPSVTVDWEAHLSALHWDEVNQRYADRVGCAGREFSPYVGYVNLYPVMLGVVRSDLSKVRATIMLAREELFTTYGLMSVSYGSVSRAREARLPHSGLWMGPVWPSVNLMMLHAIKSTYVDLLSGPSDTESGESEVRAFYEQLRSAQAETIRGGRRWWEFFNPVDGSGEGSKTYIGTRSLILGTLYDFS